MASSSRLGGAEQPVLVPVLRWSSPAPLALPAVLRPARRFVPSAGRRGREPARSAGPQVVVAASPVVQPDGLGHRRRWACPGRGVPVAAGPGRVEVAAGPGQRASPAWGDRGRQSPAAAGSRTARAVPARPAPAGEPFTLGQPQQV